MANTTDRDQLDKFYDRLQTLPSLIRNLGLSIAEGQRAMDQNYIESLAAFTRIISIIKNNIAQDAIDAVTGAKEGIAKAVADNPTDKKKAAEAVAAAAATAAGKTPSTDATTVVKAATDSITDAALKASSLEAAQFVAKAAITALEKLVNTAGPSQSQYLELFRAIAPSHYQFTETVVEVRADLRVASESELKLGATLGINAGIFSVAVNFSLLKRSASDYHASAALRCVINAIPADHTMMNDLFARAGTPITASFKADNSFKAVLEALNEMKQVPAAPLVTPPPTPPG